MTEHIVNSPEISAVNVPKR